jgi:hypothetical protein
MKAESFKGVIENAYGEPLKTPLTFSGSFEKLEKGDEIPAKEQPDSEEILNYVNSKRKANSRQKAMQSVLDAAGIEKPTLENNVDLQVKTMVKSLVASGKYNEEQATTFAKTALGL